MKKLLHYSFLFLLLSLTLQWQCVPDELLQNIEVTTLEVTEITPTTAVAGGSIFNPTGTNISNKGICFSQSPNPTVQDFSMDDYFAGNDFSFCQLNLIL